MFLEIDPKLGFHALLIHLVFPSSAAASLWTPDCLDTISPPRTTPLSQPSPWWWQKILGALPMARNLCKLWQEVLTRATLLVGHKVVPCQATHP